MWLLCDLIPWEAQGVADICYPNYFFHFLTLFQTTADPIGCFMVCGAMVTVFCCAWCCQMYDEDKKIEKDKQENKEINKSLDNRKDDWWVQSGGPSITNGGRIMNGRGLNGNRIKLELGDGDPFNANQLNVDKSFRLMALELFL